VAEIDDLTLRALTEWRDELLLRHEVIINEQNEAMYKFRSTEIRLETASLVTIEALRDKLESLYKKEKQKYYDEYQSLLNSNSIEIREISILTTIINSKISQIEMLMSKRINN